MQGLATKRQGDLGEFSAIEWLGAQGHGVLVPVGSSPDYDLVADIEGRLIRVQVKTSRRMIGNGRYQVQTATYGGNQSWTGLVKHFAQSRCDFLFVLVEDGRRWFIPSTAIDGRRGLVVGGPKYAAFEVDTGRAFTAIEAA